MGLTAGAVWLLASCTVGDHGDPAAATSLDIPPDRATSDASAPSSGPGGGTSGSDASPSSGTSADDGVDAGDPAAVATAFGDDYLAMLSDPADRSLRTSRWASPSGLALMNSRAEEAVADGISATGPWEIEATTAGDGGNVAVVEGCIDVTRVTGYRDGEVAPWPGDRITFTATMARAGETWLVDSFSIPGEACPG